MKILKAKRYCATPLPVLQFDVNSLMILPSQRWIEKRYPIFKSSIDKTGMIYPVIVTDLKHYWQKEKNWPKDEQGNFIPGKIVHTGNKRVIWAKENGYTHIEGYFVFDKMAKDNIIKQTYMSKEKFPQSLSQLKEMFEK